MQSLFEDIKKSGVFDEFVARVLEGEDVLVEGLWDSVKALLSAILVDQGAATFRGRSAGK